MVLTMRTEELEDVYKVEAANSILGRLGETMLSALKDNLARGYHIRLDGTSSFSLDYLHLALRELLGERPARWLTDEIQAEITCLLDEESVFMVP